MEISNSKPPARYSWDDESGEHHTMMLPNVVSVDMQREFNSGVVQWIIDIDCQVDTERMLILDDIRSSGTLEIGGDINRSFSVYVRLPIVYDYPEGDLIIVAVASLHFSTVAWVRVIA